MRTGKTFQRTHRKQVAIVLGVFVVVAVCSMSFGEPMDKNLRDKEEIRKLESAAAFMDVYKVLMSPRCMNCHPSGDVPLQGDDSHLHTQGVQRGKDGKGMYALKCTNCHQPENTDGLNMPPGNEVWHLPPANMRMVFQGKTPKQLAAQLKDPNQNGHKTMKQLIEHVSHDKLVLWGWNPGDGRTLPPLSHEEFSARFKEWVDKGAVVPN